MLRTKRELDNYVQDVLARTATDEEKITKCLPFAKAYFGLREFEVSRRFLSDYLKSGAPDLHAAHKLMGDTLVELSRHEEALDHYKSSYDLGKSRDVLNKICGLIQNGFGMRETPRSRTNWLNLQKASSLLEGGGGDADNNNPACLSPLPQSSTYVHVSTPRPQLFTVPSMPPLLTGNLSPQTVPLSSRNITGGGLFSSPGNFSSPSKIRFSVNALKGKGASSPAPENIGDNLLKLIEGNKGTVHHHTTLLQFYLTDQKIREAAFHVHKYMLKFASNFDFLEKAVQVMEDAVQDHLDATKKSVTGTKLSEAELFSAYFFVLENYIGVLLDKNLKDVIPEAVGENRLTLAATFLKKFDQQLFLRGRKVKFSPLESWWPPFLKHCRSQLAFFVGILLQLRWERDGKQDDWFKPCFAVAASFVIDQPLTMIKLRDPKLQQRAFIECCYRSLIVHTLLKTSANAVTFTTSLKDQIYERCFPPNKESLLTGSKLTSEFCSIPTDSKVQLSFKPLSEEKFWLYLRVAQLLYPESLHHQVWLQSQAMEKAQLNISAQWEQPPFLHSVCFEEIPVQTANMHERCDADSVCQIDTDTFITLSTVLVALDAPAFPKKLPHLSVSEALFTPSQLKWWACAYRLTHGVLSSTSSSNKSATIPSITTTEWAATENRFEVQRGLEMIRNAESTMPPMLLSLAGSAFTCAALSLEETNTAKEFLHLSIPINDLHQIYFDSAEHYFQQFVGTQLDSSLLDQGSRNRKNFIRFFDIRAFSELTSVSAAVERARFVLGWKAMERRDFEGALTHFTDTNFPESTLYSAEMYKLLAEEELEMSNADSGIKRKALLEQTKDLLYETLTRKEKKSQDYLLGKGGPENNGAPLPHPKLENDSDVLEMIDEVEAKLREVALSSVSLTSAHILNSTLQSPGGIGVFNNSLNGIYPNISAVLDGEESDHVNGDGDHADNENNTSALPSNNEFMIRTPAVKGRRPMQQPGLCLTPRGTLNLSSTPTRKPFADLNNEDVSMDEEVALQAAAVFGDSLEKILEQNSVILDTITQMADEIKDLNDRVEMLKKSKKFSRRLKSVTFAPTSSDISKQK